MYTYLTKCKISEGRRGSRFYILVFLSPHRSVCQMQPTLFRLSLVDNDFSVRSLSSPHLFKMRGSLACLQPVCKTLPSKCGSFVLFFPLCMQLRPSSQRHAFPRDTCRSTCIHTLCVNQVFLLRYRSNVNVSASCGYIKNFQLPDVFSPLERLAMRKHCLTNAWGHN